MRVFFLFSYEFIKKDFVRLCFDNTKNIKSWNYLKQIILESELDMIM